MFKKISVFLLILFYVLCLPLYSYADVYYQGFKLTSSGVSRVASAASGLGSRYVIARALLSRVPYVGLAITVGLLVYNQYSQRGGLTHSVITPPNKSSSIPEPEGTSSSWGQKFSDSQEWNSDVYYTGYDTANSVCSPDSEAYRYMRYYSVKGTNRIIHVSNPLPQPIIVTGGRTEVSLKTTSVLSNCDTSVLEYDKPQQKTVIYVYYSSPSSFSPQVSVSGSASSENVEAEKGNTTAMVQTVQIARGQLDAILSAIKSGIRTGEQGSPQGNNEEPVVSRGLEDLKGILEEPLERGYVPLWPEDMEETGLVPNIIPEPNAITPPTDTPPAETSPPPIPDDACLEYQRTKHFDYSSLLQSAQAVPLLGLLSKLVINPASQEFNGRVSFTTQFGSHEIDLTRWRYNEVIAIFRFVVIGGAFILGIKIIYD